MQMPWASLVPLMVTICHIFSSKTFHIPWTQLTPLRILEYGIFFSNRLNDPEFVTTNFYTSLKSESNEAALSKKFTQILENFALYGWACVFMSSKNILQTRSNIFLMNCRSQKSNAEFLFRLEAHSKFQNWIRRISQRWHSGNGRTKCQTFWFLGWILYQVTKRIETPELNVEIKFSINNE